MQSMDNGWAYACAPHLVQSKWTHCHTIVSVIRVRWVLVKIAWTDMERVPNFHPSLKIQSVAEPGVPKSTLVNA